MGESIGPRKKAGIPPKARLWGGLVVLLAASWPSDAVPLNEGGVGGHPPPAKKPEPARARLWGVFSAPFAPFGAK